MSDVMTASPGSLHAARSPHQLVKRFPEAFRLRPWIYWTDLLLSAAVGWTLFAIGARADFGTPTHLVVSIGAIFSLYRVMLLIHELAHRKAGELPYFEGVWNAIGGIPLLVPSLMYVGSHIEHHKRAVFGTSDDPEYVPIARWSRWRIARFVITVAFVPAALILRFGVLGPLSRIIPPLRRWVVGKLSSLVINSEYTRPMPKGAAVARWNAQEAAAAVFVWAVAGALWAGWIPLHAVFQWWIVGGGILIVNQVRTLVAHGYENEGEPTDSEGELLDSINLKGKSPVTVLFAPVGMRYHALHHAVPGLPYHSLGWIHRRLLAELPRDASYHYTQRDGLVGSLRALWERAAAFSGSRAARGL